MRVQKRDQEVEGRQAGAANRMVDEARGGHEGVDALRFDQKVVELGDLRRKRLEHELEFWRRGWVGM